MINTDNQKIKNANIWACFIGENNEHDKNMLADALAKFDISLYPWKKDSVSGPGLLFFNTISSELFEFANESSACGKERVLAVAESPDLLKKNCCGWNLLKAGVSDVIAKSTLERVAAEIKTRFSRWLTIDELLESAIVKDFIIGKSQAWRAKLREIVEIAKYTDTPALILGESGTGKELIAHLIHELDARPSKRELVILDCSTVVPELSGSEFFGHEKGAFTGAVSERDGAFALANGGTLFLDEIGELPLHLQAQLLRVVQEHTYKRVGGNTWRRTEFRLIAATNRNLREQVREGKFRADLYYRIADFICELPPLRERLEDIIPLAEFFLHQCQLSKDAVQFDDMVREFLLKRNYPGNIRDLRQVVTRLVNRYSGGGTITMGSIPPEDRPMMEQEKGYWLDDGFERSIYRAVLLGVGLKEIGRAAEDWAIRIATIEENGNLQRAARRLGVTDRTLQLRCANRRQTEEI